MRAIRKVRLDKVRPAVILTREIAVGRLSGVTIAPISSTIHGVATEVPVGRANGLDHDSAVKCDDVQTVAINDVGDLIGYLTDAQDLALTAALHAAFDLL